MSPLFFGRQNGLVNTLTIVNPANAEIQSFHNLAG
jgi:hypothetical protein